MSPEEIPAALERWRLDTMILSDPAAMLRHSVFRQLARQPGCVNLLMSELRKDTELTGTSLLAMFGLARVLGGNPVQPQNAGRVALMRLDWLDWDNMNRPAHMLTGSGPGTYWPGE